MITMKKEYKVGIFVLVLLLAIAGYFNLFSFISFENNATYQGVTFSCEPSTSVEAAAFSLTRCDICSINQAYISGQGYGNCQLYTSSTGQQRYRFNMITYTSASSPNRNLTQYNALLQAQLISKSLQYGYCPDNQLSYLVMSKSGACAPLPVVNNTPPVIVTANGTQVNTTPVEQPTIIDQIVNYFSGENQSQTIINSTQQIIVNGSVVTVPVIQTSNSPPLTFWLIIVVLVGVALYFIFRKKK